MTTPELALKTGIRAETLELIIAAIREFGATKAVLYGSRARGDFSDPSDIDIAYWGSKDIEAKLWFAFEELPTIHKIDIVHYDSLTNEGLKQNIMRDAVALI
jgi:predicted nucleotidyltransferase